MINITYTPYVGLLHGTDYVHTKMVDGKLHFYQMLNNAVAYTEFYSKELPVSDDVKYIGYVELKNATVN